ncbi:hypothetical protein PM082_021907 [Marasmius tenuissimus]|nr:hypothetical protein PM082_021907 [Marasmius tenuissimus]
MNFPPPDFSLPPTKSSVPSLTFSRRTARRPKYIPLYATVIPKRVPPRLSIHRVLPAKVICHPYSRREPRRPVRVEVLSSSSEGSDGAHLNESAPSDSSGSPGDVPESPLTPSPDERVSPGPSRAEPICIPPPTVTKLTVASAGWNAAQQKEYRGIARKAVQKYLDSRLSLQQQDFLKREAAKKHIEDAVPVFQNHKDSWGADLLLRDQIRSLRNTGDAKTRRADRKAKDEDGDDESDDEDAVDAPEPDKATGKRRAKGRTT